MTRGRCSVTCEPDEMSVTHACCAVRSPLYFDFLSHRAKRVVHVPFTLFPFGKRSKRPKSVFNRYPHIPDIIAPSCWSCRPGCATPTFPVPFIESSLRLNVARLTRARHTPRLIYASQRFHDFHRTRTLFASFPFCLLNNSIPLFSIQFSARLYDFTGGKLNPLVMDDIVAQLPHNLTNEWLRELRFLSLEIHINEVISTLELIYIRFEETFLYRIGKRSKCHHRFSILIDEISKST